MSEDRDFDFEPLPGLPEPLPEGERLIWRGSPDPLRLAASAFRLPLVGAWFVALAGWQIAGAMHAGATVAELTSTLTWTATLAATALALLGTLGWVIAKGTVYTITSRRVIVRHGVAMPMAINVPFAKIDAADVREGADGIADITLKLAADSRVPRLLLWPHVRPLRYLKAEPALRAVRDGSRVATLLAQALAQSASHSSVSQPAGEIATPLAVRPRSASRPHDTHQIGGDVMLPGTARSA